MVDAPGIKLENIPSGVGVPYAVPYTGVKGRAQARQLGFDFSTQNCLVDHP
jgi:hypothetical protein